MRFRGGNQASASGATVTASRSSAQCGFEHPILMRGSAAEAGHARKPPRIARFGVLFGVGGATPSGYLADEHTATT